MFKRKYFFTQQLDKQIQLNCSPLCLVDVGANQGQFSNEFLKYFDVSKHVLIEPIEEHISALNARFKNSTVINSLLSDNNGYSDFYQYEFS